MVELAGTDVVAVGGWVVSTVTGAGGHQYLSALVMAMEAVWVDVGELTALMVERAGVLEAVMAVVAVMAAGAVM